MVWKPGESGNPGGRPPKGNAYADLINEFMEATDLTVKYNLNGEDKELKIAGKDRKNAKTKTQVKMILILAQMSKAAEGDTSAFKELLDRAVGKSVQLRFQDTTIRPEMPEWDGKSDPFKYLHKALTGND